MYNENIDYRFSSEKNKWLKENRGICFEDVVLHIQAGHILEVVSNPNKSKYQNQKIYVLGIDDYAYLVPFVEEEEYIFLKTIIPNRKATKQYLKSEDNDK